MTGRVSPRLITKAALATVLAAATLAGVTGPAVGDGRAKDCGATLADWTGPNDHAVYKGSRDYDVLGHIEKQSFTITLDKGTATIFRGSNNGNTTRTVTYNKDSVDAKARRLHLGPRNTAHFEFRAESCDDTTGRIYNTGGRQESWDSWFGLRWNGV
ncbi:hypothetical protein [Streptomyces sp. NPDC048445]|uniref:hypothetical protein n=1 Tax=unclassified Streptomyces TaxID=2593676 RepID=UPI003715E3CF